MQALTGQQAAFAVEFVANGGNGAEVARATGGCNARRAPPAADLPPEMVWRLERLAKLGRLNLAAQRALCARPDAPPRIARLP